MTDRRPRRLRWGLPDTPVPKHPYRDTLLVYGAFALIVVLVAWATGGGIVRAVIVAALFYAAASSWSIYRWRERLRDAERREGEA